MINRFWKLVPVILLIFAFHYNVTAGETVPGGNNEDTVKSTAEQEAFQRDRELIKQLMLKDQKKDSPGLNVNGVEFELGDSPVNGSASARLIIVEFSDYSCPHCAGYVKETYPEIYKKYINPGKIRYAVIDYPLPDNNLAVKASEAAYCAGDQGKFWEMHSAIMHDQESLSDLASIAYFVDLNINKFERCLEIDKYNSRVMKHISLASGLEIPSVPGFIIASIDPENPRKVKGITYIRGAKPFELFQQEIDKALADIAK